MNGIGGVFVLVAAFFFAVIYLFSDMFNLNLETGLIVIGWLASIAAVCFLVWLNSPVNLVLIWPVAVAFVWVAFWPALDYWSLQSLDSVAHSLWASSHNDLSNQESRWYAEWYSKWLVSVFIVFGGYWVDKKVRS